MLGVGGACRQLLASGVQWRLGGVVQPRILDDDDDADAGLVALWRLNGVKLVSENVEAEWCLSRVRIRTRAGEVMTTTVSRDSGLSRV